jgi:hypothetical protein
VPLLPEAVRASTVVTGNPIRPEVFTGQADKAIEALNRHGFDRRLPAVYVTGDAQGARTTSRACASTRRNVPHRERRASTSPDTSAPISPTYSPWPMW